MNRYAIAKTNILHELYKKDKIDIKIAYIGNIKNKIKQNNLYKKSHINSFFIIKNAYISINSPLIISSESKKPS